MDLTEGLYKKYALKRVFYSAYLPVVEDRRLPALNFQPPLLGNTASTRQIGCCGIITSTPRNC